MLPNNLYLECSARGLAAKKKAGIYGIYCHADDKIYIGQSGKICQRFYGHRKALRTNAHINTHLQNAWNKHGNETFHFFVIEHCEKQNRFERERFYIEAFDKKYLFNMSPPFNPDRGQSPPSFIDEKWREKISRSLTGRPHSPEHKKNIRTAIRKNTADALICVLKDGKYLRINEKEKTISMRGYTTITKYKELICLEEKKILKILLKETKVGKYFFESEGEISAIINIGEIYYSNLGRIYLREHLPKTFPTEPF